MATVGPFDLCDICDRKHKTRMAVKWCRECEQKLCEDCDMNHPLSKVSRLHTVIDINVFRNIPGSFLKLNNFCSQHAMKFSNFCPQHDTLGCPACTTGSGPHSECKTFPIQDVIKTEKTSEVLKSMETSLKSLTKNIGDIIKDRHTNIRQLQEQRQKIETEIKQTKEAILKKLDVMEREIMEDLNSRAKQNTVKLKSEIADLEKRLKISEYLKSTTALVDLGSELQSYIESKSLEAEVARETNSLHELVNSGSLKQFGLRFEKDSDDKCTVSNDNLFGRILDDVSAVSFCLTSELDKQAQVMSKSSVAPIDNVKLSLLCTFNISGYNNNVVGCSVIPSDGITLANDGHSCVVVLNQNGEIEQNIQITPEPHDVTVIDNSTIALSCDEGIKIINIRTGNTEKTISTSSCTGLEYYNGSLICGVSGKGIVSVNLTNSNMTTLVQDTRDNDYLYCTVYKDKIYISRFPSHTITCYSVKGEQLWEYYNTSVVHGPFGIAVDNNSNVYVASYDNNRVVVLSPDGKRSRTVLTEKDGINFPTALHFDRFNNRLTVVNQIGKVFIFHL